MLNSESIKRLFRFGLVGLAVMGCFMALNGLLGRFMSAQVAFFAAYPPALMLHFLLNKLWTFGDRRATTGRHVAEYIYTVVVTFFIQWPVFTVAVHGLGWKPWMAAGVANMAQMTASFLLMQIRVFRASPAEAEEGAAVAWHRLVCLLTTVAVGAVILWTALQKWEFPPVKERQRDYYNLLAHGFSKGSLALDLEVPAALKNAENPWDPATRPPGVAPADISYFNGKFYLYFGVVPVVALVWPFQRITGLDLPLVYTTIVFCLGAYFVLVRLWLAMLRDHFPRASLLTKVAGLGVLGLAGGLLSLARRASIWEMPIAAGQFFMAATLFAAYRALHAAKPGRWLAATGLLLGLAVGSRPTLAFAGGGLVVLVLAVGGVKTAEGRRRSFKAALAAGLPLALILGALLAYNYARFGRVTEFGLNYQLTAGYEAKAQHFSLGYIHYNWLMYFWNSPQWGRDFPFVHPVDMRLAAPAGYYGYEFVYGALKISPLLWFALLLPTLAVGKNGPGRVGQFVGVVLAVAGGLTAVLLSFNTATARYTADFMPWWLLLGLLGWAGLEARLGGHVWLRGAARGMFAACALGTGIVAYCAGAELHGIFRFLNPAGYASVARLFDRPVAQWEKWFGRPAGAWELDLVFPERPLHAYEPILTMGVSYEAGYVFVHYIDAGRIEFGIVQSGRSAVLSDVVTIKPGKSHRVRIDSGALYPPKEHPFFERWAKADVEALKEWTTITVDDRVAVDVRYALNDASPGSVKIGENPQERRRFSGRISTKRQVGLPSRPVRAERGGDVVIALKFPPVGGVAPQPVVMAGGVGNADFIALRLLGSQRFQLGYESWGAGFWESGALTAPTAGAGVLRVRLGSILNLDEHSPLGVLRDTLAVWLDDRLVWWRRTAVPLRTPATVEVGINSIHSTAVTGFYEARITHWDRSAFPTPWKAGPFSQVELLIGGRGEGAEPLAAVGVSGGADTLGVEWLTNGRARLLYDHWSAGVKASEVFDWAEGTAHVVRLELPGFAQLDGAGLGSVKSGTVRAWLDDRLVWSAELPYFVARSDSVVLARNVAGSSVVGDRLRAVVLDIAQREKNPERSQAVSSKP